MHKFPLVLLALGTTIAFTVAADDLPRRDSGLWEMKTALAEMGGMGMNFQTCVDDSVDDLMPEDPDADCDEQSYRRDGNRIVFEAICRADGSTAKIKGEFTGDFTRNYRGEIRTTYTPPLQGMASSTMTMEARWVGPCKPGQKPGDVIMMGMPGMGNINLEEMMKNLPQMQTR